MEKYTLTLHIEYEFAGALKKEYTDWLKDYPDTEEYRTWFLTDRFIAPGSFDAEAKFVIFKED